MKQQFKNKSKRLLLNKTTVAGLWLNDQQKKRLVGGDTTKKPVLSKLNDDGDECTFTETRTK